MACVRKSRRGWNEGTVRIIRELRLPKVHDLWGEDGSEIVRVLVGNLTKVARLVNVVVCVRKWLQGIKIW